jgi:hypothetical protein
VLTIRDRQMKALRSAADARLVPALVAHVRASFPRDSERHDDVALAAHATATLALARSYGLATRQELFRLANLTMRFGLDWPTAPELRWLHACMTDTAGGTPGARLRRAVRRSLHVLDGGSEPVRPT